MTDILRARMLAKFTCLGDKCEDTCCRGWSMQLDEATRALYEKDAPELLEAVEPAEETPWIMRKDPESGYCVKLEGGLCGIHKQYGDAFLGDACHFYPRVTRKVGDQVLMTATLSCPEIARLALADEDACAMEEAEIERLPHTLKNYQSADMLPKEMLAVHEAFLNAARDTAASAESIFLRIAHVCRFIDGIDRKSWPEAIPFFISNADAQLPPAEVNAPDPFNLLHALCGLIVALRKKVPGRLMQTVSDMENALAVRLDWEAVQIHTGDDSLAAYQALQALWEREGAARYAPVLRRWLQVQLSMSFFPFAGLGATSAERITIIGVRLATVKLALMCACGLRGAELPPDDVIRIVQSLSRFLDHLGDPSFSLQIYKETGWVNESRMRGLLAQ